MPVRRKIRDGRRQYYRKAHSVTWPNLFAANSTWSTYSSTYSRRTSYQPIDVIYLRVLNVAMKSSSCTGTRLNWRRKSKTEQDDSVEGLMLCYVCRSSQLLLLLSAQCILVRWERGSSQRRALWSVENEALPRSKALWSAESEAESHGKISNFPTFLLYLD